MGGKNLFVSVIMPVYNQVDSLIIALKFFYCQSYPHDKFEVIVVDDGSTDDLKKRVEEGMFEYLGDIFHYVTQENKGRAAARNKGVLHAKGELLIFCDADRFPERDFIKKYINCYQEYGRYAFIGCAMDYYGLSKYINNEVDELTWEKIIKYSRKPLYYSKISKIFNINGLTNSQIGWASFLVGNSCLNVEDFKKVGGFDEDFKAWGFEHFELAFRLQNKGIKFWNCPEIYNYHIPHARGNSYYKEMINSSIEVFQQKHRQYPVRFLADYLLGEMSLQDFEKKYSGFISEEIINEKPIIYKVK
jgi:GT2 family glycosyltransferase